MEKTDNLSIFCYESVSVLDKTSFYYHIFQDMRMTYWLEDADDIDKRMARMFDILFGEVIKNKNNK